MVGVCILRSDGGLFCAEFPESRPRQDEEPQEAPGKPSRKAGRQAGTADGSYLLGGFIQPELEGIKRVLAVTLTHLNCHFYISKFAKSGPEENRC